MSQTAEKCVNVRKHISRYKYRANLWNPAIFIFGYVDIWFTSTFNFILLSHGRIIFSLALDRGIMLYLGSLANIFYLDLIER